MSCNTCIENNYLNIHKYDPNGIYLLSPSKNYDMFQCLIVY